MSRVVTSQQCGFARNARESLFPHLWHGLQWWMCPQVNPRGTTLFDLSPNNYRGQFENMLASQWGISQGRGYVALDRAGFRDCVNFGDVASQSGNFTVCGWVYKTVATSGGTFNNIWFISRWVQSSNSGNEFYLSCGNAATGSNDLFNFAVRLSTTEYTVTSTNAVTLNTWCHLCGVRRGARIEVYLNGVFEGFTNAITNTVTKQSRNLKIGDSDIGFGLNSGNSIFVDDCRIYNRDLSAAEIRTLARYRGIGLELAPKRRRYRQDAGPTFNPAWARGSNQLITPGVL